tara:strand:- start:495 stop:935 length:441 start_codon:yes stop_codon:yes gene_type:complete
MINVAMVNKEGAINHVTSPATDEMYSEGEVCGDYIARFLDQGVSVSYAIERLYWNNGWQTKESRPNDFYLWESGGWSFKPNVFWAAVRCEREYLIGASDWTQFADSPLTATEKAEWATYRQALRDVPETYAAATSLDDIIWPTKPE